MSAPGGELPEPTAMLPEIKASGRDIIFSVSGGKDSTAMVLWATEEELHKTNKLYFVFADTGWEHRDVYEYVYGTLQKLCEKVGTFHEVGYPGGMEALVLKKGAFPWRRGRFCTENLKTHPIRDFIRALNCNPLPINAVGIRAAESTARSQMLGWEPGSILGKNLCDTFRPLIHWTKQNVIDAHARAGVPPCSLYLKEVLPVTRIGCYPCIMSSKADLRHLAQDPDRVAYIKDLEERVAVRARERLAEKGESPESRGVGDPAFFQARVGGTGECWPIDKVAQWAQTSHGGRQLELFLETDPSRQGCSQWGLCDHDTPGGPSGSYEPEAKKKWTQEELTRRAK